MKKLNKQEKELLKRIDELHEEVRDERYANYMIIGRFKDFIINGKISFWYESEDTCEGGDIEIDLNPDLIKFLFDIIEGQGCQIARLSKMAGELFDIKTSIDPDYMDRKSRG